MLIFREIQENESDDVYKMFQEIPAEENETTNKLHGLNMENFKIMCKKLIERAKGKEIINNHCPQTIYVFFDNWIPIGFGKFRKKLNELAIKNRAGNFAYMVRPSCRNKGYGTEILKNFITLAKKEGLKKIEGSALKDNIASCRVMEKNSGKIKQIIDNEVVYTFEIEK